jgi:membrane associated rhomboid family serine protease
MSTILPLRTDYRDRSFPWVTTGLIVANVLVFLYELALGDRVEGLIEAFGTVPLAITTGHRVAAPESAAPLGYPYLTLITSMFLHGGWLHLLGNMLFLWVFGQNVEDVFGHGYYLFFYLVCGVVASLAQVMIAPESTVPSLGASGAISGVLGAYLVLFPLAHVRTLVRIGWVVLLPSIPAYLMLGGWFVLQLLSSLASQGASAETGGVAYSAHIGGFIVGFAWGRLFRAQHAPAMARV